MIEERFKDVVATIETSVEAARRTGLKVLALSEGYAKLMVPLEGNINHVGTMYAGALFTLGESPGGAIFMVSFDSTTYYPIVKEISLKFRRPALTDVSVEVRMTEEQVKELQKEVDEKGKADYALTLDLKDAKGEVVAIVTGTWQMRKIAT